MGERSRIEDLRDEHRAGDLNNPIASPNLYDRHKASVESSQADTKQTIFTEASKGKARERDN